MHRVTTPNGNITYRAPMTDDGHADRCNALALCLRAGSMPMASGRFIVLTNGRRARINAERRERSLQG
jgi:phage FluMu gp28-like protein